MEDKSAEWRHKATHCIYDGDYKHNWIPITWGIGVNTKHAKVLMCTNCFHEINITEAFEHRLKA